MISFTRKTNRVGGVGGDIIDAGHINELQEAIELGHRSINVTDPDFGATGDGATDDTAAIQAAITAAEAVISGQADRGWVEIYFPKPAAYYKVDSSLLIGYRGLRFVGAGGAQAMPSIRYTATSGALFQINTYDPPLDYTSGAHTAQGTEFVNLQLQGTYSALTAPGGHSEIGILDFEGGSVHIRDCTLLGFVKGFVGVASDFTRITDSTFYYNDLCIDLLAASQQTVLSGLWTFENQTAIRTQGTAITAINCAFVDNIGTDVKIEGDPGSTLNPLNAAQNYGNSAAPGGSVTLINPWFERYRTQSTKPAFVEVGVSNTADDYPVRGVRVQNPALWVGHTNAAAECLVKVGEADGVEVDDIRFQSDDANYFPTILFTQANTYDSSGVNRRGVARIRNRAMRENVSDRRINPTYAGALISPGVFGDSFHGSPRPLSSNPYLRGDAFGWTKASITTSSYSPAGGEALFGSGVTLAPGSQFASIYQKIRLESWVLLECVIRYKQSGDDGIWRMFVADESGSPTPPDEFYRYLPRLDAALGEIRFHVYNYGTASLTTPTFGLQYLGTDLDSRLHVDYLACREITPADTGGGRRREVFGTAAPASGTWRVGDVVWHDTPAASGSIGWVCTTAGTPGTWKTFGAISA